MPRKLTYEEVKRRIESVEGYILLSKEYVNSKTKLEIQCPEGHKFDMRLNSFSNGQRCPVCDNKLKYFMSNDMKNEALKYVKNDLESHGYELLETGYKGSKYKMKIRCPEGHIFRMSYNTFRNGHRCCVCQRGELVYYGIHHKNNEAIEYISEYVEQNSLCELLPNEWHGSKTLLRFRCEYGHIFKMEWGTFREGSRCPLCQNELRYYMQHNMLQKAYKYVRNKIEIEGYNLLGNDYKGEDKKLKIQCPKGHKFEMSYHAFNGGHRCPICKRGWLYYYSANNMKKKAYDYVKERIEEIKGYKLLDKIYIDNSYLLTIRCPDGHEFNMNYNSFVDNKQRCPICDSELKFYVQHSRFKDAYDYVKKHIEVEGYTLLSEEYVNGKTKLKIKCPDVHKFKMSYDSFRNGSRCPICQRGWLYYYSANGMKKEAYEYIKEYVESRGYKLLSTNYVNCEHEIRIQCPKGHTFSTSWDSFKMGRRCPKCNNYHNQNLMTNIVQTIFDEEPIAEYTSTDFRFHDTGGYMRFDAAIPSRDLFFEYQGEQHYEPVDFAGKGDKWAKEQLEATQKRDQEKRERCKERGVTLIEIPYTWNQTESYVLDALRSNGVIPSTLCGPIIAQSKLEKYDETYKEKE